MKEDKKWERWTNWELWPFGLRYLLITPVWIWYCLRARSPWFFTPSNPTITFGGFEGEGKKEMYDLLPPSSYPRTIFIAPGSPIEEVLGQISQAGFQFPFIVKPDVGMKGLLFRKIDREEQLLQYHEQMPIEYIVQDLVTYPIEVSVFYYRYPEQSKGVITGFIRKDLMEITGDGEQSIGSLIRQHPKAKHRMEEMQIKHGDQFERVLEKGEAYPLAHAANLNRGARFTNLQEEITGELAGVFDALSIPAQFYYGRYDIKCRSIEDLKKGRYFSILEYNGSGAEPNHVYQSGLSWWQACRIILQHWKVLYEISRYNHKQGIRYWPFMKGLRFMRQARKHLALLEQYDRQIII